MLGEKQPPLEKRIAQLFISKKLWGNFSGPQRQSVTGLWQTYVAGVLGETGGQTSALEEELV